MLATSDIHGHLLGYDYFHDRPSLSVGLSRVATLIRRERTGCRNSLLFDNGDFLQGTPLTDLAARQEDHAPHPVLRAMRVLGYDAVALGNHEFNHGLDLLDAFIANAPFPMLCANIRPLPGRSGLSGLRPHALLRRRLCGLDGKMHDIRIGVFGVLPPQVLDWDAAILGGQVQARDILAAARDAVSALRDRGADLVIALCHSGIGPETPAADMENAAVPLAAIDGVDAVIAGHLHDVFPGPHWPKRDVIDPATGLIHGVPMVMPGFGGSHLARIDLLLAHDPDRGWQIRKARADALPVHETDSRASTPEDPTLCAEVAATHGAVLADIRRPVGTMPRPVHSYFSLVADDAALHLIAEAQRRHVEAMLAGSPLADLPILSAAAPMKCGGRGGPENFTDVPSGEIALRHIADMQHFPNEVSALRLTGAELADWLEMSAGLFRQIYPDRPDQMLHDPAFPSYNFDVIHGVCYEIDVTAPPRYERDGRLRDPGARRVVNLRHEGRPVAPDAIFILATNSFRAAGGGRFPHAGGRHVILSDRARIRDLLCDQVAKGESTWAGAPGGWSLRPVPGASVLFDTGPIARERRIHLPHLPLEEVGPAPGGFVRFRLHLDRNGRPHGLASPAAPDYIAG